MSKSGKTPPDSELTKTNTSLDQPDNSDEAELEDNQLFEATLHFGPLPSPQILADYEKAVPGLATRIIEVFETQQKDVNEMSRRTFESRLRDAKFAAYFPFVFCILLIITAFYSIYSGFELVAVVAVAAISSQKLPAIISALKKHRE